MFYNDMFDALDSLFDEETLPTIKAEKYSVPQFPPCEMIKLKDGTLKIVFALAKYKKEDISISTEENKIIIGTVDDYKKPEIEEGTKVLAGGIKTPAFKNSFAVPETKFNFNEITASFKDGVLEIAIPSKEKREYKPVIIA